MVSMTLSGKTRGHPITGIRVTEKTHLRKTLTLDPPWMEQAACALDS